MKRILFLLFSILLLSTSQTFSQDDKKGAKEKRKMQREIEKEKKKEQKLIEEENKKFGGEKKELEKGDYVPTYSVMSVPVAENIYMLKGKGGNIGLFIGEDGAFMIDNQFAEGSEAILQSVGRLTDKPLKFLVNTHHHGDHTGGNENMINEGASVFAHENVRKRLEIEVQEKIQDSVNKIYQLTYDKFIKDGITEDKAVAGAKRVAGNASETIKLDSKLPLVTFTDELNFHFNNEKILIFHVRNAHTDGDAVIYFMDSNVIHTGDIFFNGRYPYIDLQSGGNFDGYMEALSKIIMLADDETKIIPGHGELANLRDIKYTQSMLEHLHSKVAYHYISRKTREEILAMKDITKEFDDKGYGSGYVSSEKFLEIIYNDVARKYRGKQVKE